MLFLLKWRVDMFTRINELKNWRIFRDFKWNKDIPSFNKYNLVYAWNGAGKTTLSKLFQVFENNESIDDFPDGKFKVEIGDKIITEKNFKDVELNIRVFNKDFIKEHISFEENTSNIITYLGKEAKETAEKKKELELEIERLNRDIVNYDYQEDEKKLDGLLKNQAKEIKTLFLDNSFSEMSSFTKKGVLNIINSITAYDSSVILSDNEEIEALSSVKSLSSDKLPNITSYIGRFESASLLESVKDTLQKDIIYNGIEELDENGELKKWVKQGFIDYHKNNKQCKFCGSEISNHRWEELNNYFNDEYLSLSANIDIMIKELELLKETPRKLSDYLDNEFNIINDDIKEYNTLKNEYNDYWSNYPNKIDLIINLLKNKKSKPNTNFYNEDMFNEFNEVSSNLKAIINKINAFCETQISKIKNIEAIKTANKNKVLNSIVMKSIFNEYSTINSSIGLKKIKYQEYYSLIATKSQTLRDLNNQSSSTGKAIGEINKYIKSLLGRENLFLELNGGKPYYLIKRDNENAENLSEGEKSAISFAYFLAKFDESDFNFKEGIVVIDDPISSLDSNILFQAYSLIMKFFNGKRDFEQLFILTHNYHFFREFRNDFIFRNKIKKNEGKDNIASIYSLRCNLLSGLRNSYITKIDKTLENYQSEYQYLFSEIYNNYKDLDIKDTYYIPNIARRFIEIFSFFKFPEVNSSQVRIEQLIKDSGFSECKGLWHFLNILSHGQDGNSLELFFDYDVKEQITNLLYLLCKVDEHHFRELLKICGVKNSKFLELKQELGVVPKE